MTDAKARLHAKVSRLPPLPDPLDPDTAAYFARAQARGNSILNLHLATAHAPKITLAKNPLAMALRSECDSPRLYRELAIVRVGQVMECPYELDHHMPLLLECGMSEAQVAALDNWREHRNLYDERSLAVLAWIDSMAANKGDVDDATFAELSRLFTPKELVEIGYNAAIYFGNALILKSFRIELDDAHVRTTPGKF
jgi:alkylhydroperoxidase family enzyme